MNTGYWLFKIINIINYYVTVYVVDAIANWPLTHMKNPIIYNQTPKFKDLTFKIPISV